MHTGVTQNHSDEASLLAGIPASSRSGPAAQVPVILVFSRAGCRRPIGSEEASSPDWDVPPTIGELAVLMMARFTLPRMTLAQGRRGLNPAPASAHDPWEE
jgi:hypothetical protein